MGIAIHRTTRAIHNSVSTPDYDPVEWFTLSGAVEADGPALEDFAALHAVPHQYWKFQDDPKRLLEMSDAEKAAVDEADFEALRTAKIAGIDQRTSDLIDNGFSFNNSEGGVSRFSLSIAGQMNLTNMLMIRDSGLLVYPVLYASKDDKTFASLANASDVVAFYGAAFAHLGGCRLSGTLLKVQIMECSTVAQLNLIVDTRQ